MSADLDVRDEVVVCSLADLKRGNAAIYLAEARIMLARERARLDELSLLLDAREAEMVRLANSK